jgi:hypothetical protein
MAVEKIKRLAGLVGTMRLEARVAGHGDAVGQPQGLVQQPDLGKLGQGPPGAACAIPT